MTKPDNGGPAFPLEHEEPDGYGDTYKVFELGMSRRDVFAKDAPPMPESVWRDYVSDNPTSVSIRMADWAYAYADAMIERSKR